MKLNGKGMPGWQATWWALMSPLALSCLVVATQVYDASMHDSNQYPDSGEATGVALAAVWMTLLIGFIPNALIATWLRPKIWRHNHPDLARQVEINQIAARVADDVALVCTNVAGSDTLTGESAHGAAWMYRCGHCGHQIMIPGMRLPATRVSF